MLSVTESADQTFWYRVPRGRLPWTSRTGEVGQIKCACVRVARRVVVDVGVGSRQQEGLWKERDETEVDILKEEVSPDRSLDCPWKGPMRWTKARSEPCVLH